MNKNNPSKSSLWFLFKKFLKIGSTAFGGFMALISIVQRELVEKEKSIKDSEILDGISIASVLPGPMAVNVIAFIGYRMRGIKGGLVSMAAVILPSFLLILLLSVLYFRYGNMPEMQSFFNGILPAVAAIILAVSINLSKKNINDYKQIILTVAGFLLVLFVGGFFITLLVILFSGIAGFFLYRQREGEVFTQINLQEIKNEIKHDLKNNSRLIIATIVLLILMISVAFFKPEFIPDAIIKLDKLFLSIGSVSVTLFGGGYVFIPLLQELVVDKLHWVTQQEFIDAIAMGQITPGPIMISATFIGYKVAGIAGAIVATVAIFLPPGLLIMVSSHLLNHFKNSKLLKSIFYGIHPAVIGMIYAAFIIIFKSIPQEWTHYGIFALSFILTYRFGIDLLIIIPAAGVLGILIA